MLSCMSFLLWSRFGGEVTGPKLSAPPRSPTTHGLATTPGSSCPATFSSTKSWLATAAQPGTLGTTHIPPHGGRKPTTSFPEGPAEAKFDGNPECLGFFLVQVIEFVHKWGLTFPDEASCLSSLRSLLEGPTPKWYLNLYLVQGPKMWNV